MFNILETNVKVNLEGKKINSNLLTVCRFLLSKFFWDCNGTFWSEPFIGSYFWRSFNCYSLPKTYCVLKLADDMTYSTEILSLYFLSGSESSYIIFSIFVYRYSSLIDFSNRIVSMLRVLLLEIACSLFLLTHKIRISIFNVQTWDGCWLVSFTSWIWMLAFWCWYQYTTGCYSSLCLLMISAYEWSYMLSYTHLPVQVTFTISLFMFFTSKVLCSIILM